MRCLECGCHDYFECKLIEYANEYDVKPERFAGEKHHRNEEDLNSLIARNTDKCILCGLCVRVCDEVMGKTNLGLLGRGFDTVVSPEFSLPLEESSCMFCGQCVTVCPTGALREKQPVKKRVPVKENSVKSVCNFCAALCETDVRFLGKTVMRSLPVGDKGLLCKGGRFGILAANTQMPPATEEQIAAFRAKIASYGDSVAVILGPMATLEEAAFAKANFPAVYADVTEQSASFAGLNLLGIPSVAEYKGEAAAILLDCKKPSAVTAEYTLALSNAYTETATEQLFTAPFTAQDGTYLRADGTRAVQRAAFTSALPTALAALAALCGASVPSKETLLQSLEVQYPALANAKECGTIAKEVIRGGGQYNWNDNAPVIADFCENF